MTQEVFWFLFLGLGLVGLGMEILMYVKQREARILEAKQLEYIHQDLRFFGQRLVDNLKSGEVHMTWFKEMFRELTAVKLSSLSPFGAPALLREKRMMDTAAHEREQKEKENPVAGPWQPSGTDSVMEVKG